MVAAEFVINFSVDSAVNQNRTLLLAIDLSPESKLLVNRVCQYYFDEVDNLHVVHVIRDGLHDSGLSAEELSRDPHLHRLLDRAQLRLNELLHEHELRVPPERIHLLYGEPSFEIKRLAGELAADLVIIGSHSRSGDWLQLPGATTNCVIQGIGSDVVAVKI